MCVNKVKNSNAYMLVYTRRSPGQSSAQGTTAATKGLVSSGASGGAVELTPPEVPTYLKHLIDRQNSARLAKSTHTQAQHRYKQQCTYLLCILSIYI